MVNGTSGNESTRAAGEAFGLGQDDLGGGPGHHCQPARPRLGGGVRRPAAAVDAAYRAAFARPPTADETDAGLALLTDRGATSGELDRALSEYALAVMSLNEFIYVD